jgi:peptidyl-prolyl cis-trans isomerase SurA
MYTAQIQPALRTYLTKLREDAYIDIKPGFVDTGASPKQSKPVNTAYSAPVSKKLSKEAKKARFNRGRAPLPAVQAKPAVIKLDKNGKPKKVKREKIRYGQAPEQSLPPGAARASTGADAGVGAAQAAGAGATLAPGTAIAPVDASTINENSDADALAQKPAKTGKTRFADKTVEVKAAKVKKVNAKVADKKIATPVAMTDEEKRAAQLQAAPLGLNGDTGKKKKKKRVKGDAKQRLKEKPKDPNATPERNPDGSYPTPYHAPSSGAPAAPAPGTTTPPPASGTPPAAPTPTPDTPKPPSN